jgi:hypothetical protein
MPTRVKGSNAIESQAARARAILDQGAAGVVIGSQLGGGLLLSIGYRTIAESAAVPRTAFQAP